MAIDPSFAVGGAEWQIAPVGPVGPSPAGAPGAAGESAEGAGFGGMLGTAMRSLTETQESAAQASQALAAGEVTDPTTVVLAVERAQLAMQLAGQIRTRGVEAARELFSTQV